MRIELKFNQNWIYKTVDRIGFLHKPAPEPGHRANIGLLKLFRDGRPSFLSSFFAVFVLVIFVYHVVPFLLAGWEGVAWGTRVCLHPFWRDLTQYGFSFVAIVLLLSGRRFSEIQNELIREWWEKDVIKMEKDKFLELVKIFNGWEKGKCCWIWWMRMLRLGLVAAALILPALLFLHLLKDDRVISWHGLPLQVLSGQDHLFGVKKLPTLCGLYVCLFVWTSGIYLIVSGVFEGVLWIWFIYRVTREPLGIDPHHPDLCGGLHYFKYSVFAWSALIMAVGVLVALDTANYLGMAPTKELKKEIFVRWDVFLKRILYIAGGFSIFLMPMVPIAFQLFERKVKAEKEAGTLAKRYMEFFQGELMKAKKSPEEIKTAGGIHKDVVNLSFLTQYFNNLYNMKVWPLDFAGALKMAAAVLGPLSLILIPEAREYLKNLVS